MIRVLLVDDTEDIRVLLRLNLERDGRFEIVGEAEDGAEAVDLAGSTQPDAIVLDLAMPGMDGFEAIPQIRAVSPQTRIAVLSAFDASQMKKKALALGAHSYLEKSRGIDLLPNALVELCNDRD